MIDRDALQAALDTQFQTECFADGSAIIVRNGVVMFVERTVQYSLDDSSWPDSVTHHTNMK